MKKLKKWRHGTPPWTYTWSESDPDTPNGVIVDEKDAFSAAEAVGGRKAVYISSEDTVSLAIADGSKNLPIGFTLESGAQSDDIEVATNGGTIVDGFSGLTAGANYYLSQSAAGEMTTTEPTSGEVIFLGIALTTTVFEIDVYLQSTDSMVWNEVPSGDINGSNVTFTLVSSPKSSNKLILSKNGLILKEGAGEGFTLSGNTITMATAPIAGDFLLATYEK